MNNRYDIIIVGAGPAGSMAAMHAARGGASTLLVEKHPSIGYPLCCAEAISKIGLESIIKPRESWISSEISKVRMFGPEGVTAKIVHPDAGYVLERKIFDRDLAKLAAEAGADVIVGADIQDLVYNDSKLCGVVAHINGSSTEIEAKIIIAADGVESMIAKKAGIDSYIKPRNIHSAYQYLLADIDNEPETVEFHFGNQIAPGGYCWVFPKGDNTANVGIGICPTKSSNKKAIEYLNEFVTLRFKRFTIIERMTGGVPAYMSEIPLYKDNLLIVGDAARLIDSLSGAGIANALLSGKLAGDTAVRMLNEGVSGKAYADSFNEVKRKELKHYYYSREIFLKLTDNDFVSILKFTNDLFGDRQVTAINPFEVVKQILLAHPRLLKIGRHLVF